MKKQLSITNIIVAIAAIVGIIATFLPWVSASVFGVSVTARGTDGDGIISLVLFIAVLGLAIFGIFKDAKWAKICITIASVLALLVGAIRIPDILNNGLTIGVGIYMVIAAGVVGAIMPWLPIGKKK